MLTAEQHAIRRTVIGASEAAAVLGVDPYKTAFQVWCEKTQRLSPFEGSAATDAGVRFEGAVLDWAEEQLGPLQRNICIPLRGLPVASTCDALTDARKPVEAKTAGLFGPLSGSWGDDGSDQVPDNYLVQVQAQMLCTESDVAFLAAFLGGRGFVMFRINRSEKICRYLASYLPDWWDRHVVADVPPAMGNTSLEVLKRLRREPNKIVAVPEPLAIEYSAACEEVKLAERREKESKTALLAALGDAEAADYGDPSRILTFYEQTRKAHHVKESTFRVLRFSKRGSA